MIDYNHIIDEVFDNIGIEWRSSKRVSEMKRSILNVLREVHRLGQEPTETYNSTFTDADSSLTMPTDFFLQKQVLFKDSDGLVVLSSELNKEEFIRWNPISIDYGGSIRDELGNPTRILTTEENIQYDGTVGYYFQVVGGAITLNWKPVYNGQVDVLYAQIPSLTADEAIQIQLLEYYSEMLVNGITVRELRKQMGRVKNELEVLQIKTQYAIFEAKYREQLSDYMGNLKKGTQAKAVRPYLAPFDISMRQE